MLSTAAIVNSFPLAAVVAKISSILLALLGFTVIVLVHEFGHFIFCKLFGVKTPTFSIGMGPVIVSKKIGETEFCLSSIPIGGYLEIAGQAEPGQGSQEHAASTENFSFTSKSYWQQALILTGGVMFNLFFAYFAYTTILWKGFPSTIYKNIKVERIVEESPAEKEGILKGDLITGIEGKAFINMDDAPAFFAKTISESANKKIDFTILRDGDKKRFSIAIGKKDERGFLGCGYAWDRSRGKPQSHSIKESLTKSFSMMTAQVFAVLSVLKHLITTRDLSAVGGPVMMLTQTTRVASEGIIFLILFLAFISVNLAVINMLPIAALDGGQLLFLTIEAIIRRPLPEKVRLYINVVSWGFLLFLMLLFTYKDIVRIWF
ncbi:PDZ domain-containing protein [bacterium]|nr:PDZ domain-containing protein [bacterium]